MNIDWRHLGKMKNIFFFAVIIVLFLGIFASAEMWRLVNARITRIQQQISDRDLDKIAPYIAEVCI